MTVKIKGAYVFGGMLDDEQLGTDGADIFIGGFGVNGDTGNDRILAGAGNDTILGGDGADTLDGGAGIDVVDYSAAPGAVTASLATGLADDGATIDTLIGIENLSGSAYGDVLTGDAGFNILAGNGGNDTLDGGAGFDTATYLNADGAVTVDLALGTTSGADGVDTLRNIEGVQGSMFGDTLTGDANANLLDGQAGNDTLRGGAGNDTLSGGSGDDTAVFSGRMVDYTIATAADGRVTVTDLRAGQDGTDLLHGISHLQFSDQTLNLTPVDRLVASAGTATPGATVASLLDGSYVVAYTAADSAGDGIWFRKFSAAGVAADSAPTAINLATAGEQRAPAVAGLYDGGWAAVYQSSSASGWDIVLQRFNADGSRNGGEQVLGGSNDQIRPTLASTPDKGFVVAWQTKSADGTFDIQAQKFDYDGVAMGTAFTVNTGTAGDQTGVAVAEQDNGYLLAWQSDNGTSHSLNVGQFRWDGEAAGADVRLTTTGVVAGVAASALYTAGGERVAGTAVSWIQGDGNTATADDVVMVQRFDATGALLGSPVSVTATGNTLNQQVTGLADGSFLVTWDSLGSDGTSTIMARHYTVAGSAAGAAFTVSQSTVQGRAALSGVAETAGGHVTVDWTVKAVDGSSRVYQQVIGYDGGAEYVAPASSGSGPVAPTFSIAPVADGTTNGGRGDAGADGMDVMFRGRAAAGALVTLYADGVVVDTVDADGGGLWSTTVDGIDAGQHAFTATATDALGQVSVLSEPVLLTVPHPVVVAPVTPAPAPAPAPGPAPEPAPTPVPPPPSGGVVAVPEKAAILGTAGADHMMLSATASTSYDAGDGRDTVVISSARSAIELTKVENAWVATDTKSGNVNVLMNVERVAFADMTVALDTEGVSAQAFRLYQAAFDRTPDKSGLGFWIGAMDAGATLYSVAHEFIASPEFTSLVGSSTPSDEVFLTALYTNVLHRPADGSGYDWWLQALHGGAAREGVLVGFSESAENQATVIGSIEHGIEFIPYG